MKLPIIEQHDPKDVIDTLQRVYRRYTPKLNDLTVQLLSGLQHDPKYTHCYTQIQKLLMQDKVGQEFLRKTRWPALWSSAERTRSDRKVSHWLKQVAWTLIPLGPR